MQSIFSDDSHQTYPLNYTICYRCFQWHDYFLVKVVHAALRHRLTVVTTQPLEALVVPLQPTPAMTGIIYWASE